MTSSKAIFALFLYFVVKVPDEKIVKVSIMVGKSLGGCLIESVSTILCKSLLEDASYLFSIKLTSSCVYKLLNIVLCLSVQVFEKSLLFFNFPSA